MELLSWFFIFIESTLQGKFFSCMVALPYLTYLINGELKKSIIGTVAIIFIFSLQNSNFLFLLIFFSLYFIFFYFILQHLSYKKENTLVFSTLQTAIVFLFFYKYVGKVGLGINFIGFSILNYLYIKRFKIQKRR